MDNFEVAKFLGVVTAVWPSFDVSEQRIKILRVLLRDKDCADAMHAVNLLAHTMEGDFAPSIPTLLKAITKIGQPEAERLGAEEAFRLVREAISRFGQYREPQALKSLPPKVALAAKSIGWRTICVTEDDDLGTLRAHFYRTYDSVSARKSDERFIPNANAPRIEHSELLKLVNTATRTMDVAPKQENIRNEALGTRRKVNQG